MSTLIAARVGAGIRPAQVRPRRAPVEHRRLIGDIRSLAGRDGRIRLHKPRAKPLEQRQAVHHERRPRLRERVVPRNEHLARAPPLLEEGVALLHEALVGAQKLRVLLVELHAESVERRAADACRSLDHVEVVRAEQHARHHAPHPGGGALLTVAGKRALAVGDRAAQVDHAAVALKAEGERARALALRHQLRGRGLAKARARRQKLQRLDKIRLTLRVAPHEHGHARVELERVRRVAAVVAHRERARKDRHVPPR